ncbi:MAG: S41 family peptidase [bacterium]
MFKKKQKILIVGLIVISIFIIGPRLIPQLQSAFDRGYEQIKILIDIIGYVKANYVEEVETKNLIYGAASGMVRVLDPFSQFMEPDVHKEMKIETEGKFGGLGIRIAIRDKWLTVITPIPGTPAYREGIMPNDKIIEIEGKSTKDITLQEAVKQLRGKPGTKVNITVAREGNDDSMKFVITREWINIKSVVSKMLEDSVGYVRLIEFSKNTGIDMNKAIKELSSKGMRGLVLDLRNNPGGLLYVAVDVCKEFLGNGKLIVYTQGRDPNDRKDFTAEGDALMPDIPLAVLVNSGSASGSEIVAGALQDHKRAIIIGSETFGKASVQSVIPLTDGSGLRLTTARYYTPSGRSIHRNEETGKGGITPDIIVEIDNETEIKLRAQNELIYAKDKNPKSQVKEEEKVQDIVLNRAREILKAKLIFDSINSKPDNKSQTSKDIESKEEPQKK